MEKKIRWVSPKLTALLRDETERVLASCKNGIVAATRPSGPGMGGCAYAVGWRCCNDNPCEGNYPIELGPCGGASGSGCMPGGAYIAAHCGCYATSPS